MRAGQLHVAGDCEIREARVRGGVVLVHLLCLGCGTIPLRVRENTTLWRFHFASDSIFQCFSPLSLLLLSNMLMFAYTAVKLYQRQQFIKRGNRDNDAYSTMRKKQFVVSFPFALLNFMQFSEPHVELICQFSSQRNGTYPKSALSFCMIRSNILQGDPLG